MDEVPSAPPGAPPAIHSVEVRGCFGWVQWRVGSNLYDILPRAQRSDILQMTVDTQFAPFFERVTERLLEQADKCYVRVQDLDTTWSLHTEHLECLCIGEMDWNIGQGLWDNLPDDQRAPLLEIMMGHINQFLHQEIMMPLFNYAANQLRP